MTRKVNAVVRKKEDAWEGNPNYQMNAARSAV